MHAGLDVGYVSPSALRSWSQNHLVGASLGAEIAIREKTTITLKVAQALSRPTNNPVGSLPAFEGKETIGFVGLKVGF
jgi:hemolysin activation/secretion protein